MKVFLIGLLLTTSTFSIAQLATVRGTVSDNITKQPVVGAKIILSEKHKVISDYDGKFQLKDVEFGVYNVKIMMLSFDTLTVQIDVNTANFDMEILMGGSQELEEVQVIGNLVKDRKTPVAVSNIGKKELTEELGSQDLPMILNSTPGVHATQRGGGDGDARITIRGFDQRNIGVMIDGVPVNDMENGWVYWSNWFGLDAITQQIQVQRGLGATKLAMPSVGGTMNILTENTGGERKILAQQEYGTGSFSRTSLSYKSGTLKNGWGVLFSGSYKQGNGWIDQLNTQGAFYYLKVQKKIGKHVISLSGFGAPQNHGQRPYTQEIDYFDKDYAEKAGVNLGDSARTSYGIRHNEHWGYYTDSSTMKRSVIHERRNYYHKPQITLKDFWKVSERLSISNMAYVSIGRGGGERFFNSSTNITFTEDRQVDWDKIVYNNQFTKLFGTVYPTIDTQYDSTLRKSSQVLAASVNNHQWIGGISQFDFKMNDRWNISGGLDYRNYVGQHYTEIVNLLGGDYFVNNANKNSPTDMKFVGDRIARNDYQKDRNAYMQWAGGFGQAEFSSGRWTAFLNVSAVANSYRGEDYHMRKHLDLGDTTLRIGYYDTVTYNNQQYTRDSEGLKFNNTGDKWLYGNTVKTGANFNVDEKSNVYINLGYLNRTPQYSNVVDNNTNSFFFEILNERITAFEAGYGFRSKKVSVNTNAYYTIWENKPIPFGQAIEDPNNPGDFIYVNLNGMDALHMGVELDFAYQINRKLTFEGMASVGDWKWTGSETFNLFGEQIQFDARGVHVGNAAQSTYAGSIRYSFIPGAYLTVKYTYFDRYYSDFNPFTLIGANGGRESWKIPSYGLMSIHSGYRMKIKSSALNFRASVFNALNTLYISDARNNQFGTGFDATSAGVFIGQGLRFNVSIAFEF